MRNSGSTRSGGMIVSAILAGAIVLITFGTLIAELAVRHEFLGRFGLNRTESFFVTQLAILLLLLAAIYASRRLRGFLRSKPAPEAEATFFDDSVLRYLWIGATVFLPYALAVLLSGLSGAPHARLVMSIWFDFYIGLLALRIATGYARSLRDEDRSAEATADQAGESEGQ